MRASLLLDRTSPAYGVAFAAAFGLLALVSPAELRPGARMAHRAATAVTQGLWTATSVGTPLTPARKRAAVGAATAVASLSLAPFTESFDRRAVAWIGGHGARHPRRWWAAVAAASTLAVNVGDRAAARHLDTGGAGTGRA